MYISIDIIAKELSSWLVVRHVRSNTGMDLERHELYDPDSGLGCPSCLYIFAENELPPGGELPEGAYILCYGVKEDFDLGGYRHLNFLGLGQLDLKKCVNLVSGIFVKYVNIHRRMEELIQGGTLQELIDLATEVVGMPLCMLDRNHNTVAISSNLDSPDDVLWSAMRQGYGYAHHEIIRETTPKVRDIVEVGSVEVKASVSKTYVRVNALYSKGRPSGVLGVHKLGAKEEPFEEYTRQLHAYAVECANRWLDNHTEIKTGRGRFYEHFLLDVIEGKINDPEDIQEKAQEMGLQVDSNYQLGMITFAEDTAGADFDSLMDHIESIIPNSRCAMQKNNIFVFFLLGEERYLPARAQKKLSEVLNVHEAVCMLSTMFNRLTDTHAVRGQIRFATRYCLCEVCGGNIQHYYDLLLQHSIKVFAERVPLYTACHPMLQTLLDHDKDNNTDYYNTLKTYLRYNCSVSKTAKLLHLHRNSVIYRFNRITELLGNDLEEWHMRRQLLFSMECLDYYQECQADD